jgi:hypothetical protein
MIFFLGNIGVHLHIFFSGKSGASGLLKNVVRSSEVGGQGSGVRVYSLFSPEANKIAVAV